MWILFNKVKTKYSTAEIAKLLNVAPGTVSRWITQ
jgi:IS30 family transposase